MVVKFDALRAILHRSLECYFHDQGKLEVVKRKMAIGSIDILGINELKWTGMCEFDLND